MLIIQFYQPGAIHSDIFRITTNSPERDCPIITALRATARTPGDITREKTV